MHDEIQLLKLIRKFVVAQLEGLDEKALVFIPDGFNNNILWNTGHILSSQQMLTYGLANQKLNIPTKYLALFRKGTSPADWTQTPDIKAIKELLLSTPKLLKDDYKKEIFNDFNSYTTSNGIDLTDINKAIAFNNFHEGLHLGIISSIKKLL